MSQSMASWRLLLLLISSFWPRSNDDAGETKRRREIVQRKNMVVMETRAFWYAFKNNKVSKGKYYRDYCVRLGSRNLGKITRFASTTFNLILGAPHPFQIFQ